MPFFFIPFNLKLIFFKNLKLLKISKLNNNKLLGSYPKNRLFSYLKYLKINDMPDKKDYFDRINYVFFNTFIKKFKFLLIFNRIKLFLKISKILMPHTLKYNKNFLILIIKLIQ